MADLNSHDVPGLTPRIAVAPGASTAELLQAAHGLLNGALDVLARDDLTQEQWTAVAALGVARAFIVEATGVNHG